MIRSVAPRTVALGLVLILGLSACATVRDSRFNPFNWFGQDQSEPVTAAPVAADPRPLIGQVLSLNVDRFPGGAIIRTMGLPATQGFWDAELLEVPSEDPSEIVYEFRVIPPPGPRPRGTQRSREIIAGDTVTTKRLDGVRRIVVVGQQNRRSVRR